MQKKVVRLWSAFLDKIEPDVTLELDEIQYSNKHGHEICVMHLTGKNSFPKMTTEEILSNPKARAGLSKDDLITITQLDMEIKLRKSKYRIVEYDRNGIVIVENDLGQRKVYSEKEVSSNSILLENLNGKDGHGIGYRIGFKDGISVATQKQNKFLNFRNLFGFKRKE